MHQIYICNHQPSKFWLSVEANANKKLNNVTFLFFWQVHRPAERVCNGEVMHLCSAASLIETRKMQNRLLVRSEPFPMSYFTDTATDKQDE